MKRYITILYLIVAFLAIWLGYACYCNLRFDSDSSAGLIVASLCGIVTLLIGFQIYNAIEIKKEVRKAVIKAERVESSLRHNLSKIEEQVIESRFLANSVIKFLKAQQDQGFNDKTLVYLDTLVTLKYLLLSNIKRLKLEGESELYGDCIFDLNDCIQGLEEEQNKIVVRLFNNYHSLYDELYSSIFSILEDPQYQMEDADKRFFQDMNRRRRELFRQYGGITNEEIKEINKEKSESSKGKIMDESAVKDKKQFEQ